MLYILFDEQNGPIIVSNNEQFRQSQETPEKKYSDAITRAGVHLAAQLIDTPDLDIDDVAGVNGTQLAIQFDRNIDITARVKTIRDLRFSIVAALQRMRRRTAGAMFT